MSRTLIGLKLLRVPRRIPSPLPRCRKGSLLLYLSPCLEETPAHAQAPSQAPIAQLHAQCNQCTIILVGNSGNKLREHLLLYM